MEWLNNLRPETLGMLIPIAAILVGGVLLITKAIIRHRERLAMIEKGMHPDQPPPARARREREVGLDAPPDKPRLEQ